MYCEHDVNVNEFVLNISLTPTHFFLNMSVLQDTDTTDLHQATYAVVSKQRNQNGNVLM